MLIWTRVQSPSEDITTVDRSTREHTVHRIKPIKDVVPRSDVAVRLSFKTLHTPSSNPRLPDALELVAQSMRWVLPAFGPLRLSHERAAIVHETHVDWCIIRLQAESTCVRLSHARALN